MNVIYEAENPDLEASEEETKEQETQIKQKLNNPKDKKIKLPQISQNAPKHIKTKVSGNPQLLIDIKFREHQVYMVLNLLYNCLKSEELVRDITIDKLIPLLYNLVIFKKTNKSSVRDGALIVLRQIAIYEAFLPLLVEHQGISLLIKITSHKRFSSENQQIALDILRIMST
jgi:hypothetical protein